MTELDRLAGEIPELALVLRLRKRKVVFIDQIKDWHKDKLSHKTKFDSRNLSIWIDTNTTGLYYTDKDIIAFQNEQDMIMFKLGYKND